MVLNNEAAIRDCIKAAGPRCAQCDRLVDNITVVRDAAILNVYEVFFDCHGDRYFERIFDIDADYLTPYFGSRTIFLTEQLPTIISSSSAISWTSWHEGMLFGGPLTKTVIPKPKTPPRLAPILSATRVARAITFED